MKWERKMKKKEGFPYSREDKGRVGFQFPNQEMERVSCGSKNKQ